MDPASNMESLRELIRDAFEASPKKSKAELAKLMGISPTQITSLLKPGGRRLQAAEVPIVERYLGINLRDWDAHAPHQDIKRPIVAEEPAAGLAIPRPPQLPDEPDGEPVPLDKLPPEVARYLREVVQAQQVEIWLLTTDLIEALGYLRGDYVVVDRNVRPRNHEVVLAEVRRKIPIFRAYAAPYLLTSNRRGMLESPILPSTFVSIVGVVTGSVRISRR